jgi:hypothetical protein
MRFPNRCHCEEPSDAAIPIELCARCDGSSLRF